MPLALVGGLADAAPALAVDGAVLDAAALGRAPPAHAHLVLQAVPHSRAPRWMGMEAISVTMSGVGLTFTVSVEIFTQQI